MRLGLINGDFSDTKVGLYLTNILSTLEGALACILCCKTHPPSPTKSLCNFKTNEMDV